MTENIMLFLLGLLILGTWKLATVCARSRKD